MWWGHAQRVMVKIEEISSAWAVVVAFGYSARVRMRIRMVSRQMEMIGREGAYA